jgi:DNA polymerase elongation subunit (family B)
MAERYEEVLKSGKVVKYDKRYNSILVSVKQDSGKRDFVFVPCVDEEPRSLCGDLYRRGLWKPCEDFAFLYLDVETHGSVDVVGVPKPVLSAAFYSSMDDKWSVYMYIDGYAIDYKEGIEKRIKDEYNVVPDVQLFTTEELFLKALCRQIARHDVVTGWNSKFFDIPYILSRMRSLHLDFNIVSPVGRVNIRENSARKISFREKNLTYDINGVSQIDLVAVAEKQTQWFQERPESLSLDTIADIVLSGQKKAHLDVPVSVLWDTKRYVDLAFYNFTDTWLTYHIDRKMTLTEYCTNIRAICPTVNLDFSDKYATIYEHFIAIFYPEAPPSTEAPTVVVGGFTMDPVKGLHENVVVFDFSGMYPNLIRQFNISPDAFVKMEEDHIVVGGVDTHTGKKFEFYTSTTARGYLTKIVDRFYDMRKGYTVKMNEAHSRGDMVEYKKYFLLQLASKTFLNSAFGVFGFEFFAYYAPSVVNGVTSTGQELIQAVMDALKDGGYKILYADTDSVFVGMPDLAKTQEALELGCRAVDKFCSLRGCENRYMKLEHETTWDTLILPRSKKKYIGLCSLVKGKRVKDELYFKGFDVVKKDTPKALRPILKDCVKSILMSKDLSGANLRRLTREAKARIDRLDSREFVVYKAIGMPFEEYKVYPQHVRAAIWMNETFRTNFSKQNYSGGVVYIKHYKGSSCAFISDSEIHYLTHPLCVDREKYYDMFVIKKLELLLDMGVQKGPRGRGKRSSELRTACDNKSLSEFLVKK